MPYTAKQVEEILESLTISYDSRRDGSRWKFEKTTDYDPEFSWSEFEEALEIGKPLTIPGLGVITPLVVDGGGEGSGEHCEIVFKVTTEQYFKKNGYYASFHGTDWDGEFFEVQPTEKVVTVYPRIES